MIEGASRNPDILGGKLCLAGTRFPVARLFAELAEGYTVSKVADEYDLDELQIRKVLASFAQYCSLHELMNMARFENDIKRKERLKND